jgi:hypothetical protein
MHVHKHSLKFNMNEIATLINYIIKLSTWIELNESITNNQTTIDPYVTK